MPHTRVYIEILKEKEYGVVVIENISKEYLNIDPSELTKRFVRGDKVRSSEGSGLGLAIAESLVKLQNGIFANSIDGDLFKVEVKLYPSLLNRDTVLNSLCLLLIDFTVINLTYS